MHALPDPQKHLYRRLADGMTGFNLFVSRTVDAVWNGREPEVPVLLEYQTADGEPIANGALVVRHGGKDLFHEELEGGKAEIALTGCDAPHAVLLRRGTREATVATVRDLLGTDALLTLGNSVLGIRLARTVAGLPPGGGPPSG